MFNMLTAVIENVNTGLGVEALPFIIAGGVLVVCIIVGVVVSNVSKKNKKKRKAQKKNENK